MNTFEPKKHSFKTEVIIEISEKGISMKSDESSMSIDATNLDSFAYNEHREHKISPAGLWCRFVGISFLLVCFSEFKFGGWSTQSWSIAIIIGIINAIVLLIFMFDSMLELNIFRSIVDKYFSNHVYIVGIGNKSGNNISFITLFDEQQEIKKLEENFNELKKCTNGKAINLSGIKSNCLDELKKLGELHKTGILTEEEFNQKKTELLNMV